MPQHIIHISDADADAARYEIFHHPNPIIQKRMMCFRMRFFGFIHEEIANVICCCRNTMDNFEQAYVKASQGRFRLNAICASMQTTHTLPVLHTMTLTTAETVVERLEQIA